MTLAKRLIPCLDVDAGRVVKGTNFVDLRDAGDPAELAARYDREGADEVVFLDITATVEGRSSTLEVIWRKRGGAQPSSAPRADHADGPVQGGRDAVRQVCRPGSGHGGEIQLETR